MTVRKARKALRMARATANQGTAEEGNIGAWQSDQDGGVWRLVVDGHADLPGGRGPYDSWFQRSASALLDGFSIEELTEAGG